MPRIGPTMYITYDESTGQYRIGETSKGMRSWYNWGGRRWPKAEKLIAEFPAPADRLERRAMETALIQEFLSSGIPLKNRKIR